MTEKIYQICCQTMVKKRIMSLLLQNMILENSYAKNNQLWKRVRYYFLSHICSSNSVNLRHFHFQYIHVCYTLRVVVSDFVILRVFVTRLSQSCHEIRTAFITASCSFFFSSLRSAYTSSVVLMLACPNIWLTAFISAPTE